MSSQGNTGKGSGGKGPNKPDTTFQLGPTANHRMVRGVGGDIDDVLIHGSSVRAQLGEQMTSAELERTVTGASTITIEFFDPERIVLSNQILRGDRTDVKLDGLWFRLAQVKKEGDVATLVFEDREVAYLRQYFGPKKAKRSDMTRAQFIYSLIQEVTQEKIPVWIPLLNQIQPIAKDKTSSKANSAQQQTRTTPTQIKGKLTGGGGAGISGNESIFAVGVAAGTGLDPTVVGGWTCLEAGMGADRAPASNSFNFLNIRCGTPFCQYNTMSEAVSKTVALIKSSLYTGIMATVGKPKSAQIQAILNSRWGTVADFTNIVNALKFSGNLNQTTGSTTGSSKTVTKPYEFVQHAKETNWDCIQRLATEVNWRAFMSAGVFYYDEETDLILNEPVAQLDEDAKGIDYIDFDYDLGKHDTTLTITCRARDWAVPPGSVVDIQRTGMAEVDGRYIVEDITSDLLGDGATIQCSKPLQPKKEPAPQTSTKSSGGGGGGQAKPGTYVSPFPDQYTPGRIDMGVDYVGSGRIVAIGNAKIVGINGFSNANGGAGPAGQGVSYTLSDGPQAGKTIYVYEGVVPKVQPGDHVAAGDTIATFYSGSSIEIGWAHPVQGGFSPPTASPCYSEGDVTDSGLSFAKFLKTTGTKTVALSPASAHC